MTIRQEKQTVMYHLAQVNIAALRAPIDDPMIADFVANLERINHLAESSSGFVWWLRDEDDNATSFNPFDNPLIIVNMSVWNDIESLKAFTYNSDHVQILKRKENGLNDQLQLIWCWGGFPQDINLRWKRQRQS